jgi:hypothetical protein
MTVGLVFHLVLRKSYLFVIGMCPAVSAANYGAKKFQKKFFFLHDFSPASDRVIHMPLFPTSSGSLWNLPKRLNTCPKKISTPVDKFFILLTG